MVWMGGRISEGPVARQRKPCFPLGFRPGFLPVVAALFAIVAPPAAWPATPDILLPEPFAVELPAGTSRLGPDDMPVQQVLQAVQAGSDRISIRFPRNRLGPGAWRVILSAWADRVRDRPAARREAVLVVLPHGMTPVANTGYASTPHIARDADGFVHMVWTDAWRPGAREGAMYRRGIVSDNGTVRFDTDVMDLSTHRGNWTSMPTRTAVGRTIHFAWQADATIRYRSLTRQGGEWLWSDEVDTKAEAISREQGPAIAADPATVSILSSDGHYLTSRDGGGSWSAETVPFGSHTRLGTVSLTSERSGGLLATASALVTDPAAQSGGRWTLRLARRTGAGAWQAPPGPIDGRAECTSQNGPQADVVCNAFRLLEDPAGTLHAVFLGTPAAGSGLSVQAYYASRSSAGDWRAPVALLSPDPLHGLDRSTAIDLLLDHDAAVLLAGFELHAGWRYRGDDAQLELVRNGIMRASALPVSSFIRDAMTQSEPDAALSASALSLAPTLMHTPNGRIWADVLMILNPSVAAPGVVVWQHLDVTDWLR
jgi:hypothetical protein